MIYAAISHAEDVIVDFQSAAAADASSTAANDANAKDDPPIKAYVLRPSALPQTTAPPTTLLTMLPTLSSSSKKTIHLAPSPYTERTTRVTSHSNRSSAALSLDSSLPRSQPPGNAMAPTGSRMLRPRASCLREFALDCALLPPPRHGTSIDGVRTPLASPPTPSVIPSLSSLYTAGHLPFEYVQPASLSLSLSVAPSRLEIGKV